MTQTDTFPFTPPAGTATSTNRAAYFVTVDGEVVAFTVESLAPRRWHLVDVPPTTAALVDLAADIRTGLEWNDQKLLVNVTDTVDVFEADFADLLAHRRTAGPGTDGSWPHLGSVGATATLVSSDGWAAFAIRSNKCSGKNIGKIVASVGELADVDDVIDGVWSIETTMLRGLHEEAALKPTEVTMHHVADLIMTHGGDMQSCFVVDVTLTRDELAERMDSAADAWERESLVWWKLDELDGALDADVGWAGYGATAAMLTADLHGVDVTSARRVQLNAG
jgi:hypothetical protein